MKIESAPDIKALAGELVSRIPFSHVDANRVVCFRSRGSRSRAVARIWALPKIWQKALGCEAHYIIEVISERFDTLADEEKQKTLIHELLHIPKKFSGGLVPHRCFGKRIDRRTVDAMYERYQLCAKQIGVITSSK